MPPKRVRGQIEPACDVFAINEAALGFVRKKALTPSRARDLAETFRVLGNATRVRILDALCYSELCVCDLATLLNTRISGVSHQLALLKKHRLVRSRRAGRMVIYALDDQHVRTLVDQGLAHAQHTGRRPNKQSKQATTGKSSKRPVLAQVDPE